MPALSKPAATVHEELPLSDLAAFPHLAAVHEVWRGAGGGGLPRAVDPVEIPRPLLPYVMLLDLEPDPWRLRVRLAGSYICERHGGELRGRTTDDFFHGDDAALVVDAAVRAAGSGRPNLARRRYVMLNDRLWQYVRLILPISRRGHGVDGFFKVLDPSSLRETAWL